MLLERESLKSKIHRTVSEADVHYIGLISIDEDLMKRAGLWRGEKVAGHVSSSGKFPADRTIAKYAADLEGEALSRLAEQRKRRVK
jgi:aspartate 1-decarboxylase